MAHNYVVDSVALISYFSEIFEQPPKVSQNAIGLIGQAFDKSSLIRLSIPSIVFVELFEKWYTNEPMTAKIRYEIFVPISDAPNIEIRPIDDEVLGSFISISDDIVNLENHDKLILASAMVLKCPLITCDAELIRYTQSRKVIPGIIS